MLFAVRLCSLFMVVFGCFGLLFCLLDVAWNLGVDVTYLIVCFSYLIVVWVWFVCFFVLLVCGDCRFAFGEYVG